MKVETDSYQYDGTAANTENPVINKQGFLRLPVFTNRSHLPNAADVEGMICIIKNMVTKIKVIGYDTNESESII